LNTRAAIADRDETLRQIARSYNVNASTIRGGQRETILHATVMAPSRMHLTDSDW
jgi:phage portal protein BeeE